MMTAIDNGKRFFLFSYKIRLFGDYSFVFCGNNKSREEQTYGKKEY
jgi:hypothetical protein